MYLLRDILWSYILPASVGWVGVLLLWTLGLKPYRWMLSALRSMTRGATSYGISPFQSLTTVLSGTVGTGTIAGVATAMKIGGPGALFYMWLVALLGMIIKYAEAMLAIHYRRVDDTGRHYGGGMYYIQDLFLGQSGMFLAALYALACIASACGIGASVQAHSIAMSLHTHFSVPEAFCALALVLLAASVTLGGIGRIAKVSACIVPVMIFMYLGMCAWVLWQVREVIPELFCRILTAAFHGYPEGSVWYGTALGVMIQQGVSRGVFTNEAGLGSSAFAHAASISHTPQEQSAISMISTFIDTMVVCTMTGLVILAFEIDPAAHGTTITIHAMSQGVPHADYLITACLLMFGLSTMFSWNYYGYQAWRYLHAASASWFHVLWLSAIAYGCLGRGEGVWMYADLANAVMMFPNMWALCQGRKLLSSWMHRP